MELSFESPDIIYYDIYVFTGQIKVCVCVVCHIQPTGCSVENPSLTCYLHTGLVL